MAQDYQIAEKRKEIQNTEKQRKKILRAMSKCWLKETQGLTTKIQGEIFHQLLQQPVFSSLQNLDHCVQSAVFSNIRYSLSEVKVPHSATELLVKRATVMACIHSRDELDARLVTDRALARSLGIHRRNIILANARLRLEDDNTFFPVEACQRKIHQATIDEDDVSSDEEIDAPMYAGHHDDLSDALRVGDNFAVNTEEKDSDFYILKCCTTKRMSTTNEKDAWHNRIKKKSWFV
ncbi:hypothetical protein L7F22_000935 [Adiantum nelumboides]|nr:hypothetical protein [Adiantum nelumboides]